MRSTKRSVVPALLLGLALVLAACGGNGNGSGTSTPSPGTTPTGTAQPGGDDGGTDDEGLVIEGEMIADAELYAAAQAEGQLVLYTAFLEETELELKAQFEQDTGISVDFVRIATNQLHERIVSEHGANALAADVIRMPDITFIAELVDRGVFEAYELAVIDAIPDEYVHEGGLYYTSAIGPTSLGINTEFLPDVGPPRTYSDLLDPAYRGEIAMAHIGVGTTAWIFASYTRETFGIEYWESLLAQDVILAEGNAQVADLLARGEVSVAYLRPNAILERAAEGAPVEIVWTEDAMPIFSFYIGMVSGSDNPNAAKVFMNWHMSKRGQTATSDLSGEYSPRPDVPPPTMQGVTFPAIDDQPVFQADPTIWAEQRNAWTDDYWELFDAP